MNEPMTKSDHRHIVIDEQGEAFIKGTRIKVKHLIIHYRSGMPIEEILEGFPNITAAQFFDALSYYHDHKDEIEARIKQDELEEILKEFNLKRQSNGILK